MPQAGEVERHVGRACRAARRRRAGATMRNASVIDSCGADSVDRHVGTRAERVTDQVAARLAAEPRRELRASTAWTTTLAPSRLGDRHLVRVAGADDDPHAWHVATQPGDRRQTHRAGTEARRRSARRLSAIAGHSTARRGCHRRSVRPARPARRGSRRGGGASCDSWAQNHGRPAAAGRAAEAGLDAGLEVAGDEVGVVVAVARSGVGERRCEAAGGSARARVRSRPASHRRGRRRPRGRAMNGKLTYSSK